jgi:serine/threonine-protein kinase
MAVTPGTIVGHYQFIKRLGKGGMGEVYLGRDLNLERDVAIKVLPEAFATDSQRVARFGREARLLALLNHPNIAGVYGLEEFSGTRYLILELVDGETLAERLHRGAGAGHRRASKRFSNCVRSRGRAWKGRGPPRP